MDNFSRARSSVDRAVDFGSTGREFEISPGAPWRVGRPFRGESPSGVSARAVRRRRWCNRSP